MDKEYKIALNIIDILQGNDFKAYLVGGCVRDMLMGKKPKDYDIATDASPYEIMQLFPEESTDMVGASFGVVIVDGCEIATFRKDGEYSDSRRPDEVQFTKSVHEDSKRRDLTMNAIYYDPINDVIVDPQDGRDDIENNIMNFVGEIKDRIIEDPLRIMRAARFMIKYNLSISEDDLDTLTKHAKLIKFLAKERVIDEIFKSFSCLNNPSKYIEFLSDINVLEYVLPEVNNLKKIEQNPEWHPEGNAFVHSMLVMDQISKISGKNPVSVFAGMLHDIGKASTTIVENGKITSKLHANVGAKMAEEICKRFKISKKDSQNIIDSVMYHMCFMQLDKMKRSTLLKYFTKPTFHTLLEVIEGDKLGRGSASKESKLRSVYDKFKSDGSIDMKPFINGNELMELLPFKLKGKEFGDVLKKLFVRQQNGEFKTKEDAIKFIKKTYIKK